MYIWNMKSYYLVVNGEGKALSSKEMKAFEFKEGDKLEDVKGPMVSSTPTRCSCGSVRFSAWIGQKCYWSSFTSKQMEENGDFEMVFKGTCKHCGEAFYKGVIDRSEWPCDQNGKMVKE